VGVRLIPDVVIGVLVGLDWVIVESGVGLLVGVGEVVGVERTVGLGDRA
jgi:hypothetical protein